MLSAETLDSYRRMTPAQRLRLTMDLSRSAWKAMGEGRPEIVAKRFLRLNQENELRNRRICVGLRKSDLAGNPPTE